jgi:ABC-type transporter Mla maintaining outer membrane lipid asymmetry permease subunit MlaE
MFKTCSKLYRYVFYKLYRWSEAVNSNHERHEINAVMMLSLAVITNLGTIPAVIQLITGYEAMRVFTIQKYYGAVVAVFMMIVNGHK